MAQATHAGLCSPLSDGHEGMRSPGASSACSTSSRRHGALGSERIARWNCANVVRKAIGKSMMVSDGPPSRSIVSLQAERGWTRVSQAQHLTEPSEGACESAEGG